jgi:hypothetical protein
MTQLKSPRLVLGASRLAVRVGAAASVLLATSATALLAQTQWPSASVKPVSPGAALATPPAASLVQPPAQAAPNGPAQATDLGHASGKPDPKDAAVAKAGTASTGQQWSPQEIEQAQNACVALLKNLDIVAIGAAPMRDGECGTAAPIELISVGKSPQVTFSPPVIVTCDMAAALHKWVTADLQGLAKKHLGSPLIRIDTMSSYSCRTAYGRRMARLSEHGKANAIDIRAFMTAKASAADVLANWGPTERDVASQIAAAKAAAQKQPTQTAQPSAQPGAPSGVGSSPTTTGAQPTLAETARPNVIIGIPGAPGTAFPSSSPSAIGLSNGLPPASRLGGPKPPPAIASTPAAQPAQPALRGTTAIDQNDGRMLFLKGAHASACRTFGTVLGPEANNAHRNHFHVDMAKRATLSSFCE